MHYFVTIIVVLFAPQTFGRRLAASAKLSIEENNNTVQFLPQIIRKATSSNIVSVSVKDHEEMEEGIYRNTRVPSLLINKTAFTEQEESQQYQRRKERLVESDPNRVVGHYCYDQIVHKCETMLGLHFCWDEMEKICSIS